MTNEELGLILQSATYAVLFVLIVLIITAAIGDTVDKRRNSHSKH